MTPGTQAPFFLLLLLLVLTGQKNGVTLSQSSLTTPASAATTGYSVTFTTATGAATTFTVHTGTSAPATSSASGLDTTKVRHSLSAPATSSTEAATSTVHTGTSAPATTSSTEAATSTVHTGTSAPATTSSTEAATTTVHTGTSVPATSSAEVATSTVHERTSAPVTSSASGTGTPTVHSSSTALATTSSISASATTSVHEGTSAPATNSASGLATTPAHSGSSAVATTTPVSKESQSSLPSYQSPTSTPLAGPGSGTTTGSTDHDTAPPSPPSSPPQLSGMVSLFTLSFEILNLQFNSSLEDPSTHYYQGLEKNISALFLQIYGKDFLGLLSIKFRPGSVAVESVLLFRKGTASDQSVSSQLMGSTAEAKRYYLDISQVRVSEVQVPSSTAQSGVPGWGIALLVLVCVLVLLAMIYYVTLAVFQCRRKSYGHLDIFPTRDTYHPMSEYPTYHTHGRYVPPGSTRRSPYEEVSTGNGGGSLSYTNPAVAATSANL